MLQIILTTISTVLVHLKLNPYQLFSIPKCGEHRGSVVECLTPDRGAVGLSLTGVTALCP